MKKFLAFLIIFVMGGVVFYAISLLTAVNGHAVNSKSALESALSENDELVKISGIYPDGMLLTFEFGL
ncbi:MAG: hypothetical protein KAT76_02140 [Bacteroidales bacterium]|nr:hypothetical protein [Bacteroidales bacterium]